MHDSTTGRRLRVGSLFSGYGGLDLAVEYQFIAETIWFSEINEPVARVFSHHWPDVPNLGDITAIDWTTVPSVDIVCGGFPCQDVSTVGKQAGLAPGTRSGLWANMAAAIEVLQPEWVVIENVRGLLSAPATRPPTQGAPDGERNPFTATLGATTLCEVESDPWGLGDESAGSAEGLVESGGLCRQCDGFHHYGLEFDRGQFPESSLPALAVVDPLDPLHDREA